MQSSIDLTFEWQKYDNNYQKRIQDLKLFNGDIVMCCWPNAGKWHTMGVSENPENDKRYIEDNEVEYVRLNKEENE